MTDLINGRTPEEIKAGLKACTTAKVPGYGCNIPCPYLNTPNCWLHVKSDALALIKRLESERDAALAKVPKWTSVEERLPKKRGTYLCNYEFEESGRIVMSCDYLGNKRWSFMTANVTHWMPMPEPPEVSE